MMTSAYFKGERKLKLYINEVVFYESDSNGILLLAGCMCFHFFFFSYLSFSLFFSLSKFIVIIITILSSLDG